MRATRRPSAARHIYNAPSPGEATASATILGLRRMSKEVNTLKKGDRVVVLSYRAARWFCHMIPGPLRESTEVIMAQRVCAEGEGGALRLHRLHEATMAARRR